MPRRLDAVDLEVPADLAEILSETGLSTADTGHRSTTAAILVEGINSATTVITLAQGPLTAAQLRDALRRWLTDRRSKQKQIGKVMFRSNRGYIEVEIDEHSDLEEIAKHAGAILFDPPTPARTPGDNDL